MDLDYDGPTAVFFVRLFQLIVGGICFGVFTAHLDIIVGGLINPEYGAIREIIDFVKK